VAWKLILHVFLLLQVLDTSQRIEQDHLIIGNGIYSILKQLYHTLLDPSEVVLISSPYHSGFDTMISKRVQGLVVGVPLKERSNGILEEGDVEARFGQALKRC
jgi:histidinol-phosphate/aromatic aminotransferase/cobyric acid decarboxylase-like protein